MGNICGKLVPLLREIVRHTETKGQQDQTCQIWKSLLEFKACASVTVGGQYIGMPTHFTFITSCIISYIH